MNTDICLAEPPDPPKAKVGDLVTIYQSPYILEQGWVEKVFPNGNVLLEGSDWPGPVISRVVKC